MDLGIAGRRALVTGASDGLGAGIARLLAEEGAIVGVHGRNIGRIDQVVHEIRAAGGEAHPLQADLTDPAGAERLAEAALAALGEIDILVANAGGAVDSAGGGPAGWEGTTEADYLGTFQLNLFSTVTLLKRLAPAMKARGFGRIVLMSSAAGIQPIPHQPAYGAAKAAMLNLTVSTSKWLGASGVTINAVSPGAILTAGTRGYIEGMAAQRGWEGDFDALEQRAVKTQMRIPVGRTGRVEEVAGLVGFLVSRYAGFIQGADMRIDGGVIGVVS
jgi:NAD(P)-dependent dehydrogenase (short-subunit alcohol dehydrogenase family)